jgi:transglutaminase-like putative cysteine protease
MITIDDQPIGAGFFGEGQWLTDYITPEALDVRVLFEEISEQNEGIGNVVEACRRWVAEQVKYVQFVKGKIFINGKVSIQNDLWNMPSLTAKVKVGNCANKSFLLTSLLRNAMGPDEVYCVLGNLYNGKAGGHAWVEVKINGQYYILESTQPRAPIVPASNLDRYEEVHYFNDQNIFAIPGKTVLQPFTACFSTWLKDYLNWSYIEGQHGK